jgi:hypothetical protein
MKGSIMFVGVCLIIKFLFTRPAEASHADEETCFYATATFCSVVGVWALSFTSISSW